MLVAHLHAKNLFFVVGQNWSKANIFQNYPAQITKIIKVMLAERNRKLIAVTYLLKKFC